MRRGFDIHLHYANFGIRRLLIRLPNGLPCDRRTFNKFMVESHVEWIADKKGKGGIIHIEPEADAGTYEEDIYDDDTLLHKIAPIRNSLINGDLRPLTWPGWHVATMRIRWSRPVPAGLGKLPRGTQRDGGFYELSDDLLARAANSHQSCQRCRMRVIH